MTLVDGTVLQGATASYSLRQMVELINDTYNNFTDAQLAAVQQMIDANPIMQTWNVGNLSFILNETFDSWTAGAFQTGVYSGWTSGLAEGKGASITVEPDSDSNFLRFIAEEGVTASPVAVYTFPQAITTDFTLEFRFRQYNPSGGVQAQLSLQPASGGYGNAGVDLRMTGNTDINTVNGYNMTMGKAEEGGWHVIAIYVNMTDRTYEIYDNGVLLDADIPFRNTATSSFKRLYIGHAIALTGTTDYDYIRIYRGKHIAYDGVANVEIVDGFAQSDAQVVDQRQPVPSNYSDVNISTRNVRGDGYKGYAGSLDILKQFMATHDRWVYCNAPSIIKRITDLGVNIQISVSPNSVFVTGKDTDAKFYDGTEFAFEWLPAETNDHGCLNNPDARNDLFGDLKIAVENGARSIQTDDAMFNYQYYKTGGCFCSYCMDAFTDYLLETYTAEQLAQKGVAVDESFDYRAYLEDTYGWTTTEAYLEGRSQSPLEADFEGFMRLTTVQYHMQAREYVNSLGYGEITYSANISSLAWGLRAVDKINLYKSLFNASMPETQMKKLTKTDMVSAAYLESALGTELIIGAIPVGDYLTRMRTSVARSYALGTQVLIPWDTYYTTTERVWCTVDELGDIYHFVRQYPYLFDDYESIATVGAIINLDNPTSYADISSLANTLFNAGIPFKLLPSMSEDADLKIAFAAEDLAGLDYVYAYSPVSGLPAGLQQIVNSSAAQQINKDSLLAMADSLKIAWVENGTDDLYITVRSYNGEIGAATSVHVINDIGDTIYNTKIHLNPAYLPAGAYEVVLYRPGYDPVVLTASGTNTYTVPAMTEWAVLHIVPAAATEGISAYDMSDGWSALSLGTGLAIGDSIAQNGNAFTLTTSYLGQNVRTATDRTGSQDMMPFVYKNVSYAKIADYALVGKVSANGNSGIMVREMPSANARFVSLYVENGKLMAALRTTDNKAAFYREIMDVAQDMYLKIVKNGNSFEFYACADGQNWGAMLISVELTLDMPLAGVFAFSSDGSSATATVTDVALTKLGFVEGLQLSELTVDAKTEIYLQEASKLNISATTASGLTLCTEDFDSVTYTSSDTSVMTIDENHYMHGIKGGNATLTVTAKLGSQTLTKQIAITVKNKGKMFLEENFDDWSAITSSYQWRRAAGDGCSITSEAHPDETDRSMALKDSSNKNDAECDYSFTNAVTQNYTIEFDYYIETTGWLYKDGSRVGTVNTLYVGQGATWSLSLAYTRGYFQYADGNTQYHDIAKISANQWVHIKVEVDFDNKTNTITFTNSAGKVLGSCQCAFRDSTAENTNYLMFRTNSSAKDVTVYYNNLEVYLTAK